MKKCPHCYEVYSAQDEFCVKDGHTLIAAESSDDDEVATLVRGNPFVAGFGEKDKPGSGGPRTPSQMICPKCKTVYANDFLFCLTDGNALVEHAGSSYPADPSYGETMAFVPTVFTSPSSTVPAPPSTNKNIPIIILASLSIILLIVILFMMSGRGMFGTDGDLRTQTNNENPQGSNVNRAVNRSAAGNSNDRANTSAPRSDDRADNSDENPQKDVSSLPYSFERTYSGRSNTQLTMSLKKDGSSLSGKAMTPGDWDDLHGTIQPDGTFDLAGNNRGMGVTGHWRGKIEPDGSIHGTWTANNGRRVSYSVR